jgi:hypothetical protein
VSRRKQRGGRGPERAAGRGAAERAGGRRAAERAARGRAAPASRWGVGVQIAFVAAVFAAGVVVAELAGAANLGVSFGVGQIAFAVAVGYLLVRR